VKPLRVAQRRNRACYCGILAGQSPVWEAKSSGWASLVPPYVRPTGLKTKTRLLLGLIAAVSAAGIIGRAAFGAFTLAPKLRVISPFGLEEAFCIALAGLLLTAWRQPEVGIENDRRIEFPAWLVCTLWLIAIAACFAPNLADPFLSDDYILVSRAVDSGFNLPDIAASFHTPGGDGAFRPLGVVWYQVVGMFAGTIPLRWHLCDLGLHLINCALLFSIALQAFNSTFVATVSMLTFGLHGYRPEAVVWTATACDLLACCFVLASVRMVLQHDEKRATLRLCAALMFVMAGLLSKESAYAAPVIVVGLMCFVGRSHSLRNLALGSATVCAGMFAYRWWLFKGPGGYISHATGRPEILSLHVVTVLKALVLRIWVLLLFPNNWDAPGSILPPVAIAAISLGALMMAFSASPVGNSRWRTFIGLLLATAGALLPAIHLALIGQSGLGSRILYLPSVGFSVFLGVRLSHLRQYRVIPASLVTTGMAILLLHNLGVWHRVATRAWNECSEIAESGEHGDLPKLPTVADGVYFFQNGLPECVALVARSGSSRSQR
jgi:hypothetical protein